MPLSYKFLWEEKGDTFLQNAVIKAESALIHTNEDAVLSDDSGLVGMDTDRDRGGGRGGGDGPRPRGRGPQLRRPVAGVAAIDGG